MNSKFLSAFHNTYASDAYKYLGAFYTTKETVFRVYAPHASSVSVVGDFNLWDDLKHPMKKIDDDGIWEVIIPGIKIFDNYKFAINTNKQNTICKFLKQDPYGYHFETNGATSSKVYSMFTYNWEDSEWMNKRSTRNVYTSAVNIYEAHLGSWVKSKEGYDLNYRDIAKKLIPYVKKMGYNYLELLPVMEHPFLGSWGYQVTGYFGITSRYGTPDDFKFFMDYAHKNEIGVILDWVPAHFPKDDFALYEFDGTYLYEDPSPTRMEHKSWGTRIFNYAKPEIKSFLISSACFYFDYYHIDGIRVDAVAAMLYLDYDRKEWIPNINGGNYNLEAISFLQDLNTTCFGKYGNIFMIAEESTAFPGVTKPVNVGGLGFNYKWNMGWMNDTLSYIQNDPYFRKFEHNKMTFAMSYAFSENFILPISHDEVVHGKKSLLDKMPGTYDDKFANLRAYLGCMMTYAGKKLLFMGCEFGQFIEWNEKNSLDWLLLKYPRHKELQIYVSELNKFYLKHSELFEVEDSWDGFEWIYADNYNSNTYCYFRRNKRNKELIILLNFSGSCMENYEIRNNRIRGTYKIVFNSDDIRFGGEGKYTQMYNDINQHGLKASKGLITLNINKLQMIILKKQ